MSDLWNYLAKTEKPILLYGMGNGADEIIDRLKKENKQISGIFASDGFVRGQYFHGYPILTYNQAKSKFSDFLVLTAFGTSQKEVIDNIKKISAERELYIPDVPVYGNTVFDSTYYTDNKADIDFIRTRLVDDKSRLIFDNVIGFKLSGKTSLLFAAESPESEVYEQLLSDGKIKTVFDLGAFDGDTAKLFAEYFPKCEKIVAVEPDVKNYKRLCENTKNQTGIIYVNAAISYLDGKMFFGGEGGRNQSLLQKNKQIDSVTVDTLSRRYFYPDFIKFDIEGEELNGIIGAENTIKTAKPKLMISAYHRSEDIVSIPKKVLSIRDDYKVYIRHFPCVPCWDTYYIFI